MPRVLTRSFTWERHNDVGAVGIGARPSVRAHVQLLAGIYRHSSCRGYNVDVGRADNVDSNAVDIYCSSVRGQSDIPCGGVDLHTCNALNVNHANVSSRGGNPRIVVTAVAGAALLCASHRDHRIVAIPAHACRPQCLQLHIADGTLQQQ